MSSTGNKLLLKVIILGNASVGKTSLLYQYVKNQYSQQYKATIGADFLTKNIQKGEDTLQLQIWDTAGTERYNSMGQNFYKHSEACVLVFDLTVKDSFTSIDNWRKEFLAALGPKDPDNFPFVLVGNKSDMKDDIKVTNEEIQAYCKEHNNMPYFATSAKEDIGLEETFNKVADLAYERVTKNEDNFIPEKPTYLNIRNEQKKKGCCGGKNN